MRRKFSFILTLVLFLCLITANAAATEASDEQTDIVYFDDGSSLTISIFQSGTRASGTQTGTKHYTYKDQSGEALWLAVIRGTFTYTGTTAVCTNSSCDVTVYDSAWYEVSKTVGRSGATATCELTMGKKLLGITVSKKNVSMTLTCDANGNLS